MKIFLILTLTLSFFNFSSSTANALSNGRGKDKFNQLLWNENSKDYWYEWWYFKVVDPKSKKAFYFCYGLVNPSDKEQTLPQSKAFVSAGSFFRKKIVEERFAPQNFIHQKGNLSEIDTIIQIGNQNKISPDRLQGNILDEENNQVSWDIKTERTWEFNAMGWTLFAPKISNIFWYPVQANLKMTGWIKFNGEKIELNEADGYQDRNWGTSFPKWWAWIVSNNFVNSPTTKLASGGGQPKVKVFGEKFEGYTLGVTHLGEEFHFRFPDGDKIKLDIAFGRWNVEAINKRNQRLVLEAYAPKEKFMILPFTTPQGQVFKDYEALNGWARLKLYKRKTPLSKWQLIADLETFEAGIEYGSYNELDLSSLFSKSISLQ